MIDEFRIIDITIYIKTLSKKEENITFKLRINANTCIKYCIFKKKLLTYKQNTNLFTVLQKSNDFNIHWHSQKLTDIVFNLYIDCNSVYTSLTSTVPNCPLQTSNVHKFPPISATVQNTVQDNDHHGNLLNLQCYCLGFPHFLKLF